MKPHLLIGLAVAASGLTFIAHGQAARKERALYAPPPSYPSLPDGRKPQGAGVFVLHVDTHKGIVTSVTVKKSTGAAILDNAAIDAFVRWRFKPGKVPPEITIPISFGRR